MPVGAEPTRAEIEASEWLVLLDAPSVPEAEIERFQAWHAASDENRHAYAAASDTWDKIGSVLASLPRETVSGAPAPIFDRPSKRALPSRAQIALVTGAALAAALAIAVLAPLPDFGQSAPDAAYVTAVRETRTINLADGTRVQLSPLARLSVAFDRGQRRVELSEGVALFEVAADANRPFIVATQFGEVRAAGTSFVVRISGEAATITVIDGEVDAVPAPGRTLLARLRSPPAPAAAGRSQEICLSAEGAVLAVLAPVQMQHRLAWRDGHVAVDRTPLREATLEVSRFSDVRFEFADAGLGDILVSGFFDGGDVDAFLAALRANFAIAAERRGDRITLRRA